MLTIIIGAIINLLVYFFERYWTANHPADPTPQKDAFLSHVGRLRYFYLGRNRQKYAGLIFDRFATNYKTNPPSGLYDAGPLSEDEALCLAAQYSHGITITDEEAAYLTRGA